MDPMDEAGKSQSPPEGAVSDATLLRELRDALREDEGLDLAQYWRAIVKRRWLILGVFLGFVAIPCVFIFREKPIYTAETVLLIERNPPKVIDIEREVAEPFASDEYYNTQYQILASRSLAALFDSYRAKSVQVTDAMQYDRKLGHRLVCGAARLASPLL